MPQNRDRILLVASGHAHEMADRLKSWGWDPFVLSVEWWLGPEMKSVEAHAVVIDVDDRYPRTLVQQLLIKGLKTEVPTIWLSDSPPTLDPELVPTGVPIPLVVPRNVTHSVFRWTLGLGLRQQENYRRYREILARVEDMGVVAAQWSTGFFRLGWGPTGTDEAYLSPFVNEVLGAPLESWGETLVSEDRGPFQQFLRSLIDRPRLGEIRVRQDRGGELRTLRIRLASPFQKSGTQYFQGLVEDVSGERTRLSQGDRALDLLRELRNDLAFLDAAEAQVSTATVDLSQREWEVYQLIRSGLSNAAIASRLHCTESTVKKHVSSIFIKKGVGSRVQLLALD